MSDTDQTLRQLHEATLLLAVLRDSGQLDDVNEAWMARIEASIKAGDEARGILGVPAGGAVA